MNTPNNGRRTRAVPKRPVIVPRAVELHDASELPVIYEPDVAMAWWARGEQPESARRVANLEPFAWAKEVDGSGAALAPLEEQLGDAWLGELRELVDLHASLFEADVLGVRVALSDQPLCPGFHVDKVICRLIWVMAGAGTEWVEGRLPVEPARVIKQLPTGTAAWFKGTAWPNGCALVHRSPESSRRLVATVDLL